MIAKKILLPLSLCALLLGLCALLWAGSAIIRSYLLFDDVNLIETWHQDIVRTDVPMIVVDPLLGYRLSPAAQGHMGNGIDAPVPFCNQGNFRTSCSQPPETGTTAKAPTWLFLGDSFTYGSFVAYEQTFAHRVGRQLGINALNAGTPGYGIAQMILLAYQLVPEYRPQVLVVQYSPWLTSRSEQLYAPDSANLTPTPFYTLQQGTPIIHKPIYEFPQKLVDRFEHYARVPPTLGNRWGFIFQVALAGSLAHDLGVLRYQLGRWLGLQPVPMTDRAQIETIAFQQLATLCDHYGVQLVFLELGSANPERSKMPAASQFPNGTLTINAQRAMTDRLQPNTIKNYAQTYNFWSKTYSKLVDWHPNPYAHQVIAETLVNTVRSLQKDNPEPMQHVLGPGPFTP